MKKWYFTSGLLAFLVLTTAALADESGKSATPSVQPPPFLELTSPVFGNNGVVPVRYTCRGSDINPPLAIKNVPAGTKSLVLSVHDPAGLAGLWVHWVVFNIKPDTGEIGENSVPGTQALNDFGNFYYGGPCPTDEREHRYVFTLYALNVYLGDVSEGATLETLQKVMTGKIIAKAELVGTYQNPKWLKE